ncbi:NADH oxidase [Anaeramoeba ignava]|uniref:NADH oxidase n=1 Tax=Anaeramoeba ignava TaxID=1746090 RepID=A0A9Q0R5I1_ANAIG|nr:NADH oxidase [Anaeramoeba ignava]
MSNKRDLIIIGGGPGGVTCANVVKNWGKSMGKELSIMMIKEEERLVNRCSMPYGMDYKKPYEDFLIAQSHFTNAAELKIDTVTKILPEESQSYLAKARDLAEHAEKKKVAVIGAGYIGVEVAASFINLGFDVTLVEMLPHAMQLTTDSEFIEIIEKELIDNKINLKLGQKLTGFVKSEKNPENVSHIILDSEEKIEVDFVVLSIGVRPNTKLAADCGIEVTRQGIVTNNNLQTKYPNIYALGDATQKKSLITQKPIVSQFATSAVFMAKVVAMNVLGTKKECKGVINSYCTKIFSWGIGGAGLTEEQAKAEGFDYVVGFSKIDDKYPMLNPSPVTTKMIFNKKDMKLIGGCAMKKGTSAAHLSDWFSLSIQNGMTIESIMDFQYSTHPELNARPSQNMYVAAAQNALMKLQKK